MSRKGSQRRRREAKRRMRIAGGVVPNSSSVPAGQQVASKPEPAAVVKPQGSGETPTIGDRLPSGLTAFQEAKLIRRSFNWRREARFPTRKTVQEIMAEAAAEKRGLTAVEQSIVTAVGLQAGVVGQVQVSSHRDAARNLQIKAVGVRLVLEAEQINQSDDHVRAKKPVAPAAVINNNIDVKNSNGIIADLPPDERRVRLDSLAERVRSRILAGPMAGAGSDADRGVSAVAPVAEGTGGDQPV